ncbi:asparaginase [Solicola sp. PLA-1-18]|uniref:asparaginase n=1 Tax=Solicola sp. PLA-1-18 TaxID=3380532 RepID=UPI003B778A70
MSSPVVAEVVRSGLVEGVHRGAVVHLGPDGERRWAVGDVDRPMFARSCLKPLQAVGMVEAGLDVRGRLLALVCASHSGEPTHVAGVDDLLARAGLGRDALLNTPLLPMDEVARLTHVRAGGDAESVLADCSGKHAGMLATCVVNGWDVASYLDPAHPLQRRLRDAVADLTGEPVDVTGVDGCGAPLFSSTLTGLARAFGRLVQAPPDSAAGLVAAAVSGWPEHVSGTRRDEARLLAAFPGAIAKAGAEACYAVAMPDGSSFALKIEDGGARARPVVMAAALRRAGHEHDVLETDGTHVLLGGGRPVGEVRASDLVRGV